MKCRRGKKGSCSALKEVTDVLNKKLASASPERTHAHMHTQTHTHLHIHYVLPLRFNTGADASQ